MLKQVAQKHLQELKTILQHIGHSDYDRVLTVLGSSTIGMHVRHVLEFYECLFLSGPNGTVCYDDRKRNLLLQEHVSVAIDYINKINAHLEAIRTDEALTLKSRYGVEEHTMPSSLYREVTYNIEHTVHHLAIIRIAVSSDLKYITLPSTFGYAESTIQYLANQVVNT